MALSRNFMYITSDKVEDFCQRIQEAGMRTEVDNHSVWVDYGGIIPEQVYIFEKRSYEELIEEIISKSKYKL